MAGGFEGNCPDCGHHWEGLLTSLLIGQSFWYGDSLNGRRLFCPRCCREICCPMTIDRASWQKWHDQILAHLGSDATKSVWLRSLLDRIRESLNSSSWYVPVRIDLENVRCPDCRDVMIAVGDGPLPLICPECDSHRPRLDGLTSLCTIAVGENLFT